MERIDTREADMYSLLRHPLRKRILEILGERGRVRFTDLKREVNIGVGKLYYHINILGSLIEQDEYKKYMLSSEGKRAYELLKAGDYGVVYPKLPKLLDLVFSFVTVKPVFRFFQFNQKVGLSSSLLIFSLGVCVNILAGLDPILLFLIDRPVVSPFEILFKSVIGPILVFIFCDLTSTYVFRRTGDHINLFVGIVFSQIPLILFSCIWVVFAGLIRSMLFLGYFLFFVLQAWLLLLLISALTAFKRLRVSQAALIALALTYINIVLLNLPIFQ